MTDTQSQPDARYAMPAPPAAPTTLRKYRLYRATLATDDNPLSEHFVMSYLANIGFDNLAISGDASDIIVTGRYVGVDGAAIPSDPRLKVEAM